VEFQGETKVLLAENYSLVLQQRCHDPKVVRKELSLIYFSRCGPLRVRICGFSGRNEGSAGRKRFYYSSAKLSCAMIPKLL
jgi:hypothetical protein